MKKLILLSFICLSFGAKAQFYNWFNPYPNMFLYPRYVESFVANNSFAPIYCQGFVQGITFRGLRVTSWISRWIAPGINARIYVYNNTFEPFVNTYSEIFCRY